MKGLIIIGYQGIGKTTHAGRDGCIDLESSCFYVKGKREKNWHIPYCNVAVDLAFQGYTVFTSSHKPVVEYLKTVPRMPVVVFCPTIGMKDEWIKRLQERFENTELSKDFRALMNAKDRYEENIYELVNCGLPVYQPAAMDYDLMDYIHKIQHDLCE